MATEQATPVSNETPAPEAEAREAELSKWLEKRGPKVAAEPVDARDTPAEPVAAPAEAQEPNEDETERDKHGRFRKRAKSQEATAEDVPRIRTLTAKLREAESDRDTTKAELATLRAELEQLKAGKPAERAAEPAKADATAEAATFDKPKPQIHEFATYEEWAEALTEWNLDKREFTAAQKAAADKAEKAAQANLTKLQSDFREHVAAYVKSHPDYDEVLAKTPKEPLPDVLHWAIVTAGADGPEYAYVLAKTPTLLYDLWSDAAGKIASEETVAIMRRRLAAHVAAVSPGSAPVTTTTSRASAPVKPVGASPMSADVSPDSMTGNQFRNWYHAREKARRSRA